MYCDGKHVSGLFVVMCDDGVQASIQMTNYRVYLCGGPFGIGPSRKDMKFILKKNYGLWRQKENCGNTQ